MGESHQVPILGQDILNATFTVEPNEEEVNELFEYLGLTPSPIRIDPLSDLATVPNGRRLTFSRNSENLPINWNTNRRQREPTPEASRVEVETVERRTNFNELFDWAEEEDDAQSVLLNSLRSARRSLGTAKVKIRTFTRDYILYKLTLTSAYISFCLMFGIILAYLIHSIIPIHSQSNYDAITMNSNVPTNLTHVQHGNFHDDFVEMVEHQVNLQCRHFRKEWEVSLQCRSKNEDYLEKIHEMEKEISSLQQHFSEELSLKRKTLSRLTRAISIFKQEHISIRVSSIYQFIVFLSSCCWITSVAGYIGHRYNYFGLRWMM